MKREILFRGMRTDNGEWIYGDLLTPTDIMDVWEISENTGMGDRYEVDPDTIGQYTGINDKNGEKIFEGDIVQYEIEESGEIVWDKQTARFVIEGDGVCYDFDNFYGKELVIIGNIYDCGYFTEDEE